MNVPGLNVQSLMDRLYKPSDLRALMVQYMEANECPVDKNLSKSIGPRCLYHQQNIAAAGITRFFNGTPTANSSNMVNSFQLPQNEHLIITAVRFMTGNNATLQSTDWTYGAGLAVAKNGAFDLQVNGVNWLKAMPGTRACEDITSSEQGFIVLDNPVVWIAQTDLLISLNLLAAPAASDNFRFEVHGLGFLS